MSDESDEISERPAGELRKPQPELLLSHDMAMDARSRYGAGWHPKL